MPQDCNAVVDSIEKDGEVEFLADKIADPSLLLQQKLESESGRVELVEAVATIENKQLYASCQEAIAHTQQNKQIEHLLSIPAGKLSGYQRSAVAEAFVKGLTKVTGGVLPMQVYFLIF